MALIKIDPKETSRKDSYEFLSGKRSMPMVTIVKKFDITRLVKSHKDGHKINCMLNYLFVKSALSIPEFYFHVDGETNDLYKADQLGCSFMAKRKDGGLAYCEIPYIEDYLEFEKEYKAAKRYCFENDTNKFIEGYALIGSSLLPWTEIECAVSGYYPKFTNPFLTIPKYRKELFTYYANISFQFHHLQMDGEQALTYLDNLQKEMDNFKI